MRTDHLTCPYRECKKEFEKPIMLTDFSKMPRETYYACPHCLTKVDVVVKDQSLDSVSIETTGNSPESTPSKCLYQFGYLKNLSKNATVPDGCLTCSKLLQCFVRKDNISREV